MNEKFSRRQRRTGSTSARYMPSVIEPRRPKRVGRTELAACAAVAVATCALVTLIWILTAHSVQDQKLEFRDRAEQLLTGQAATIAETIGHEILMIDQSLIVIQQAWKDNSDAVNLLAWRNKMPAFMAVADDLFIADGQHIIRQDILPTAFGQGVGSAYITFPHGSLEQFQSDGTPITCAPFGEEQRNGPIDGRRSLMYIVRPLDHPQGWLVGASYRTEALPKLFADAALGFNPAAGLVDTSRGVLQAIIGPAARRPRTDLSKSQLFAALTRSPSGIWIGESPIDGVDRMHAFHRIPNRDLAVVVAASLAEVMSPVDNITEGAHSLAVIASGLVMLCGSAVLWALFTVRRRKQEKRRNARNLQDLAHLRAEEGSLVDKAQASAARLQALLDSTVDGIALFDRTLRLVQWNQRFFDSLAVELTLHMPLDVLLRHQVAKSQAMVDPEPEVARQVGLLRTADPDGIAFAGPDRQSMILHGHPVADGGLMLLTRAMPVRSELSAPAPVL